MKTITKLITPVICSLSVFSCTSSDNQKDILSILLLSDPYLSCSSVSVMGPIRFDAEPVRDSAGNIIVGKYQIRHARDADISGYQVQAKACTDSITGSQFDELTSDGDFDDMQINVEVVSPVSHFVEVAKSTLGSKTEARRTVSQLLNLSDSELDVDPVRSAVVQKSAAVVVTSTTIIKATGGNANQALINMAVTGTSDGKSLAEKLQSPEYIASVAPELAEKSQVVATINTQVLNTISKVDAVDADAIKKVASVVKVVTADIVASIQQGTLPNDVTVVETIVQNEMTRAETDYAQIIPQEVTPVDPAPPTSSTTSSTGASSESAGVQ